MLLSTASRAAIAKSGDGRRFSARRAHPSARGMPANRPSGHAGASLTRWGKLRSGSGLVRAR
ncbi:hypothetical protein DF164_28500 [Burkholderia stagnalis]|nr:hypothetical protein DF164_28500 [Burkholderia stagnalis]RQY68703.1 hypothetical protein DF110_19360 [Burkholderia stagnalis]